MKLKLAVTDINGMKISCKVVITKSDVEVMDPGQGVINNSYCDGNFEAELEKGIYTIEVFRGKLYHPFRQKVKCDTEDISFNIDLEEVLDVKKLGLYSFDAHSHVSRDEVLDTGNLVSASTVMKGEDFNFFFAGSPYDHEVHLQYLNNSFIDTVPYREKFANTIKAVNNESYILDIGNEIVKGRYGHAFMMNYEQMPSFCKYYDEEWDPWFFTKSGDEPPYSIAYMHEALLNERGNNSIAAVAHPTSWWWHDNGEFVTNIAATVGFEILAGSIDAIVVMGYKGDHKYYQQLWFEILKNGYFLPGIAETDASFDIPPKRFLEFKTYALMDEMNMDTLCKSVREGKCIVSSGPIVLMKVNGQYPGAVVPYNKGKKFKVEIYAHRCYQNVLSKIQIIINGEVYKEYTLNQDEFKLVETIKIQDNSFILIKCYDYEGNLGITNPVYIRNKPFVNQGYMSNVSINVYENGQRAQGVYWLDKSNDRLNFDGRITLSMNVASKLHIEVGEQVRTIQLFELTELQDIFKNLYFGRFNSSRIYNPGEVPAEEFKISRIREILDHVELDLNY